MDNNKTIVYTVDNNEQALRWLDVSICSLRKHLDNDVRVVVCTNSPRDFGYGAECVDVSGMIEKYGIDGISELRWYNNPVTPMQVFRIALPLVPELQGIGKIIFVDADTEFVDKRWEEIFDYPCDYVAGVRDGGTKKEFIKRRYTEFLSDQELINEIGLPTVEAIGQDRYVNGGVLVMNLDNLRKDFYQDENQVRKMVSFCVRHKLSYLDQDLINLFFKPNIIPSRFNNSPHLHSYGEPIYLEHYTGKDKWSRTIYPPIEFGLSRFPEKMDVVYIVGNVSLHDDEELRWSLRSVAKYGRNVGKIIVTSPIERTWLSDEVIQIDSQDIPHAGYKHHNILKAILDTIDVLDINGHFMVSSDDHFYVKEVDFTNPLLLAQTWDIPPYTPTSNIETGSWKLSCADTREFLHQHNLPTINFQMHRNSLWHGGVVKEHIDLFKEAMTLRYCVEPHVVMQNLWLSLQPNTKVEFRQDSKVLDFYGIPDNVDCISCYDQSFIDTAFVDFMNQEFGEKCRYEK